MPRRKTWTTRKKKIAFLMSNWELAKKIFNGEGTEDDQRELYRKAYKAHVYRQTTYYLDVCVGLERIWNEIKEDTDALHKTGLPKPARPSNYEPDKDFKGLSSLGF